MARCSQGLGLRHLGVVLQRAAFDSIARSASGQDTGGSRSVVRAEIYRHMIGTQAGRWIAIVYFFRAIFRDHPRPFLSGWPIGIDFSCIASQYYVYTTSQHYTTLYFPTVYRWRCRQCQFSLKRCPSLSGWLCPARPRRPTSFVSRPCWWWPALWMFVFPSLPTHSFPSLASVVFLHLLPSLAGGVRDDCLHLPPNS